MLDGGVPAVLFHRKEPQLYCNEGSVGQRDSLNGLGNRIPSLVSRIALRPSLLNFIKICSVKHAYQWLKGTEINRVMWSKSTPSTSQQKCSGYKSAPSLLPQLRADTSGDADAGAGPGGASQWSSWQHSPTASNMGTRPASVVTVRHTGSWYTRSYSPCIVNPLLQGNVAIREFDTLIRTKWILGLFLMWKGHPVTSHCRRKGNRSIHADLPIVHIGARRGSGVQRQAPAVLTPGKTRYLLYRRVRWAPGPVRTGV